MEAPPSWSRARRGGTRGRWAAHPAAFTSAPQKGLLPKKPLSPKTPKAELCAALRLGNVLLPAPRAQPYAHEKAARS